MINPFHDNERVLGEKPKDQVLKVCGEILGDTLLMIADSQETLEEVQERARLCEPLWAEFLTSHIHAVRVKAFGSEVYEPKTGAEVRAFYRETLRYCLALLARNDDGQRRKQQEAANGP